MWIDNSYKIWKAASLDTGRIAINHVLIARPKEVPELLGVGAEATNEWLNYGDVVPHAVSENYGLALATDGFILSVVPVRLAENDVSGLVDRLIFQYTMGRKTRGESVFDLSNAEVTGIDRDPIKVVQTDGRFYRRDYAEEKTRFPNFIHVLPDLSRMNKVRHISFGLDVLTKAYSSIGRPVGVRLFTFGMEKPILVSGENTPAPHKWGEGDRLQVRAPFAIMMPTHSGYANINDGDDVDEEE
ncbi:hypothetical protein LCGC14_1342530 [marine sediment metagenome]|uniref:Uncharacterized protein n=1 Tax=marine sediment metagenome TaxID=412755 RepID=A0A0F9KZM4_9ZZZZ